LAELASECWQADFAEIRMRPARVEGFLIEYKSNNNVVYSASTMLSGALVRTKHAKSWLDASFGELLRQVEYKALWNSKHFVQVNRFFPSTKQCFECGYKNDNLTLSDRQWMCPSCETRHIRDLNAAKNIRAEGLKLVAEGHPETRNACGARVGLAKASVA